MKPNQIWPVFRDAIILTVLTGLGGFILGFASTDHSSRFYFYGLALSNSLFCTIGFAISGCLAVGNRWRHLAFVAAIVWVASIFNVIFFNVSIVMWVASVVAIAIFALIGGGISLLFKRKNTEETKLEQAHSQNPSGGDASSNAGDDKYYDQVANELQEKSMVAGLWTRAYAEMGGDDAKTRALYIKYRVAQLAEINRRQLKDRLQSQKREEEQRRKDDERRREETIREEIRNYEAHKDLCGKCKFFKATGIFDRYKGTCNLHARETFSNHGCAQYKPI